MCSMYKYNISGITTKELWSWRLGLLFEPVFFRLQTGGAPAVGIVDVFSFEGLALELELSDIMQRSLDLRKDLLSWK